MTTPHPIREISVMIKSSNPKRIAIPLENSSSRPSKTKSPKPESAKAYIKTSISHILPENWESPITQPSDADDDSEKKSHSPKTVARRPSKTKSPKPESAKAYIKTSISHILPENWESPITQTRDAAAGPEKTSPSPKTVARSPSNTKSPEPESAQTYFKVSTRQSNLHSGSVNFGFSSSRSLPETFCDSAIRHILPENWESPITQPMEAAAGPEKKSHSPKTVARRPSKTKIPKPESAKASIKTSISDILLGGWESPITQPRDAAAGSEKTSVKNKPVDIEPMSAEEKTFKEKLASLYTTFPAAARTQLTEARFTKYMYRAITHDNALRALFETKDLPVISNLDNLNFETARQYPFARYAAFTIKIEGHKTGKFVFEKRQDYKLMGWCQHEPFSFLVAQKAISPHQSPPPSSVCTMDRPVEAKLTTSTHVLEFSEGKVCRFQNKNVIG